VLERLQEYEARYAQLAAELARPEVAANPALYRKLARELGDIREIATKAAEYRRARVRLGEAQEIIDDASDAELLELARQERDELQELVEALEAEIRLLLVPRDPRDGRNALLEIRAGTGGDEAGLFAADLFRMYSRFAERQRWHVEVLSASQNPAAGFKEIVFMVSGPEAYGRLKYESGVHRVQRVPKTEASGRIHTSAASVAVLPEAEEVDVQIDPEDLQIDVYRSSGPGGQSVNTTDSAVRVTHRPTGLVVSCQDEKSQLKNKNKALKILRARLLDLYQSQHEEKISAERRQQIGSGDRSAKIRTYNFPQGRVTDHRINYTVYRLDEILDGDLSDFIDRLRLAAQEQMLAAAGAPAS